MCVILYFVHCYFVFLPGDYGCKLTTLLESGVLTSISSRCVLIHCPHQTDKLKLYFVPMKPVAALSYDPSVTLFLKR